MEVEVVRLLAVLDGLRLGFARLPMYSLVFHCSVIGGELQGHPLETRGRFLRPRQPSAAPCGRARWLDLAFAAIDGKPEATWYDPPRTPPWRGEHGT